MDAFMYDFGGVVKALITGVIVGAVPAICGAVKRELDLAIGGFFACLGCALILGLILAVPCCAVFLFFIFKESAGGNGTGDKEA